MTPLAQAADGNFAVHAAWPARRLPGSRVDERPGLVVVDSGLPCDTFNFVLGARLGDAEAPARVAEALAHFRAVARPFSWWLGPADRPEGLGAILEEAGLVRAEGELAMVADLAALAAADLAPEGLAVERVRTPEALAAYAAVNAANWTPPDPWVLRFYELAAPWLLAEDAPLWFYLGRLAGEPVATAELTVGAGVAGLYGISTREAFRRRGIGTALTLRPLLDARAAGLATAVLQASADGAGVYARLGFRPFGEIVEYKPVT